MTNISSSSPQIKLNDKEKLLCNLIRKYVDYYNSTNTTVHSDNDETEDQLVARITGGWVRDKLLNKDSHDLDIALNKMSGELFASNLQQFYIKHHLAGLPPDALNNSTIAKIKKNPEKSKHLETATTTILGLDIDFVNLRNESYGDDSRIPVITCGTPREDAMRRDATLNALFYNITTEKIEDFTGKGLQDLKLGILRTPLPPLKTFLDDPLRILRLIRFSSTYRNFKLDEAIIKCLKENNDALNQALINKISKERIGIELSKIFSTVESTKIGLKLLCDNHLINSIFYHGLSPEVIQFNSTHTNLLKTLHEIYDGNKLSDNIMGNIVNETSNFQFFSNEQFFAENKSLTPTECNEILTLSVILSIFSEINIYPNPLKKPTFKINLSDWIIRENLKYSKKIYTTVEVLVSNIEIFEKTFEFLYNDNVSVPKRSDIGLELLKYKDYLPLAIKLNEILYKKGTKIGDYIESLDLMDVCQLKLLMNGKEIAKFINKKPGPWMKKINDQVLRWQLDNPKLGKDDLLVYLRDLPQSMFD
ncbi:related to CCA tRNA nucleotidyltransferase, mitochondrial [Saccharomycodes ludwigii]|uniref:CCA tRNA nucleotidyltransferase, mitochondrial n=1 Tax=Saccharomycodes ludwigii TaxID=36035 RepID=A0A376B1L4_9ASCO|nr:hypothetical protein SCDLUD_001669 [Saccharomycodes ludwigii]KAH3901885.1 hypothetical protein SCDLUD_001669 [Saccharomycodes ludwigii]SSD58576.1 related to CCA tRNA nucleotidyltransferase, mitochondrial [Saccharomycodes ludwigii]